MKPSFDEMQAGAGAVRPHYSGFDRWLQQQPRELMAARRDEAALLRSGSPSPTPALQQNRSIRPWRQSWHES